MKIPVAIYIPAVIHLPAVPAREHIDNIVMASIVSSGHLWNVFNSRNIELKYQVRRYVGGRLFIHGHDMNLSYITTKVFIYHIIIRLYDS